MSWMTLAIYSKARFSGRAESCTALAARVHSSTTAGDHGVVCVAISSSRVYGTSTEFRSCGAVGELTMLPNLALPPQLRHTALCPREFLHIGRLATCQDTQPFLLVHVLIPCAMPRSRTIDRACLRSIEEKVASLISGKKSWAGGRPHEGESVVHDHVRNRHSRCPSTGRAGHLPCR